MCRRDHLALGLLSHKDILVPVKLPQASKGSYLNFPIGHVGKVHQSEERAGTTLRPRNLPMPLDLLQGGLHLHVAELGDGEVHVLLSQ